MCMDRGLEDDFFERKGGHVKPGDVGGKVVGAASDWMARLDGSYFIIVLIHLNGFRAYLHHCILSRSKA